MIRAPKMTGRYARSAGISKLGMITKGSLPSALRNVAIIGSPTGEWVIDAPPEKKGGDA